MPGCLQWSDSGSAEWCAGFASARSARRLPAAFDSLLLLLDVAGCGLLLQTEQRGLSVCLSVGLPVTTVSHAKTAEPIEMPF